ncbi:MAG: SDR family NAD(P)-dependent oxidoreductase [Reyranella sp.]|uniref:SDR family NAD(P)-dependent oxidoreductase n=1 Tax=Reyranella sp. TaxID=1929291 RepID=UPI0027309E0F|nr:SDR family NAD(P)-dependent oxidoreductase [Reyranella sp.]MDP1963074.1 SDR family NAD(P)-dependent oxidoreductase [Reyranella sp.]MDP2378754.1 SDR family NAD(P)-dependent oxidoreductase [Reyranella sp.]
MKLTDKVAVVTGTSPNIGGGIAEGLAAEGATVVCVDAQTANAVDCASAIKNSGGKAIGITCDVCNEEQVKSAVSEACATFGKIDVLVNNAAFFNKKGVLNMPLAEWEKQIAVILTGAFLFTKHVAQSMIERGVKGNVINIISTAGHQGEPGNIAYSTAKSGLLNFTRSAAMELVAHGIRVNSLTPTATDPTESDERAARWGRSVPATNASRAAVFESYRRRVPMQKLPRPSDYGCAAAFLASQESAMITGTDLRIDAGAVARYWAWEPPAAQSWGN